MLSGATRLVGLIGSPVEGSLSPRMQNAAFAARGLDWAYVPLTVAPVALEAAVAGLVALGFEGANVTIPHKEAMVECCDQVDEFASRAGSVNTLVIRDGRLLGSSTDGLAVVEAVDVSGAEVLMIGAGGAARAVATAVLDAGAASVAVTARRDEAARSLVDRLRVHFPGRSLHAGSTGGRDVVVNATPVRDEVPVALDGVRAVVDLAYDPDGRDTALVAAARERGLKIVDGLEVLVRQGAASFERWTGLRAPAEVMRGAVRMR